MKKIALLSIALLINFCSSGESSSSPAITTIEDEPVETVETIPEPDVDIWTAVKEGDLQSIKQHILYGTDLNSRHSRRGDTPLITAACHGQYEIARILIDAGAGIDNKNDEDVTAQFCAVFFGRTDLVQLLKDKGADPNIIMNQDLSAMDVVSVEWDKTRSQAVGLYNILYGVNVNIDEVEEAHPLIMEILNSP